MTIETVKEKARTPVTLTYLLPSGLLPSMLEFRRLCPEDAKQIYEYQSGDARRVIRHGLYFMINNLIFYLPVPISIQPLGITCLGYKHLKIFFVSVFCEELNIAAVPHTNNGFNYVSIPS
jgi:hypothetical protein